MNTHNCHTHIFTNRIVPAEFLPLGLVRVLSRRRVSRNVARFLNWLNPFSDSDLFDRYAAFVEIGASKSQLDIFELLRGYYPEGTRFVTLMMDMEYMDAGEVQQSFQEQLDELTQVKQAYPDLVVPFVAADPRRPNIAEIVRECIEDRGFAGIKLYPPLGYYPFDERLRGVYAYAQERGVPITSHCSRGGVYWRGTITKEMLVHPKDPTWKLSKKKNSEFCDYFTGPRNYRRLLADFPNLKVCLAHFGGDGEWESYLNDSWHTGDEDCWVSVILKLLKDERYPNVYADVSYLMHDERFHPLLKVLLQDPVVRERVLFGTGFGG